MAKVKKGDRVEWNTSQGKTTGKVVDKAQKETKVGETKLKGSKDDPVYIVKSDKTGKKAGHKKDALKKKS